MNKTIIQIAGLGVALLMVALAINKVLKSLGITGKPDLAPPDIDGSWLNPNRNYEAYAVQMHNAIDGLDWTSQKARVITNWLDDLNDEEFKHCYNIYNDKYADKNGTLRDDLQGEWIWGSGINRFFARMDRLQLA